MLPESSYMQDPENAFLWDKIKYFNLDENEAVVTFAGKLAEKNKWTDAFTKRVIEKYRRFIFLCCISPTKMKFIIPGYILTLLSILWCNTNSNKKIF